LTEAPKTVTAYSIRYRFSIVTGNNSPSHRFDGPATPRHTGVTTPLKKGVKSFSEKNLNRGLNRGYVTPTPFP